MFLRRAAFVCCICTFLQFLFVQSYENLALNKQVVDLERNDELSVLVNGRKLECNTPSYSMDFYIDLGEILSVHHVTAYFGKPTELPTYFFVHVSNTTYQRNGTQCLGHHFYSDSLTITNQCLSHGRYVTYYLSLWRDSSFCEVEVYGCPIPGHYGENCSIPCPQNCQERRCNINEGTCLGCIEGYKGPTCKTKCDPGSYGLDCSGKCGECSGDNQCHHISGTCFNGCKPGFLGLRCDRECDNGTFGQGCTELCGNCEQCHHVNGTCLKGCDPGYLGHRCDQGCLSGFYGKQCVKMCRSNCNSCNKVNGVCDLGCNAGWKGTFCEQKCGNHTYGSECMEACGNCSNGQQCNNVDGSCQFGCDAGVYGDRCDIVCPVGRYGINCTKTCGQNCTGCDRFTGICVVGCQPGWTGTYCEDILQTKIGQVPLRTLISSLITALRLT